MKIYFSSSAWSYLNIYIYIPPTLLTKHLNSFKHRSWRCKFLTPWTEIIVNFVEFLEKRGRETAAAQCLTFIPDSEHASAIKVSRKKLNFLKFKATYLIFVKLWIKDKRGQNSWWAPKTLLLVILNFCQIPTKILVLLHHWDVEKVKFCWILLLTMESLSSGCVSKWYCRSIKIKALFCRAYHFPRVFHFRGSF